MKLLVFGAGGFIGKKFTEMFCNLYNIVPVTGKTGDDNKADLTDYHALLSILDKHKPDAVLNLAGKSYHKTRNDVDIYESNLMIQLNLNEAVKQLAINPKIIFCSTSAVYRSSMEPVNEASFCLPGNSYAKAKYIQERIGLSYHPKQHVVVARLFNVIGPFQDKNFFIPAVIDRIVRYKNNEITTVKLKTLNAMRDFIYINDICKALGLLIEKGEGGEVYNICTGNGINIEQVITILKGILNISEMPLEAEDNYVKEGINYQVGSNEKICKLGWEPEYDINNSLKEIVEVEYGR
ncbi:MAG: NAD-dependent epimerase/dehydratase family protein [Nitrospirae bacterium]|nr:NAD-dependent epimerase/dehydratase family protein [Nitrospirota bacterium]